MISGLFKPRLFTKDYRSNNGAGERELSPLERSQQLYEKGKEKLRNASNDNSFSYSDREECTFKPKVDERSQEMVRKKSPGR